MTDENYAPESEEIISDDQPAEESYLGNEPSDETQDVEESDEEVKPYTAEEIRKEGIDKLDPKRIPKELEPYYKSMVADYTKKTQAVAEERRRIAALQAEQQAKPQGPKSIYDYYVDDPQGTEVYINNEIQRLAQEEPGNYAKLEQLRDLKVELKHFGLRQQQQRETQFMTELHSAIPDFATKSADLTRFAIEELGYSPQVLQRITNPKMVGEQAALEQVKAINKLFIKQSASSTVAAKQVPKQPTKVEPAGTGSPPAKGVNFERLKQEAQRSGDWTAYLDAKGVI